MNKILVVGASRGIGLELVRQYRAEGAAVTGTVRSEEGRSRLEALGARALTLDVAHEAGASALAWPIDGEAFDVVIINAGVYGPRTTGLQPPSAAVFDEVMHTNVLGAMRVLPQVVDALAPGARLAVISSRMGSMGLRENNAGWLYRASKAALNSVLKDASLELAGKAICIAFHPGWVRTDMGGTGADLDVGQSVTDMRRTLAGLQPSDNGCFFNHDGTPLAW
jgi:NAD(P)-dependent dehydrogenase (short-subunit alcohol dehydrogenase family)